MAISNHETRSSSWVYRRAWDLFMALVSARDSNAHWQQEVRIPASTITDLLPATAKQVLEDIAYTNVIHQVLWTDPNDHTGEPSWSRILLLSSIQYDSNTHCFAAAFNPFANNYLVSLKGILADLWRKGRPTKSMVQERFTSLYPGTKLLITSAPLKHQSRMFHAVSLECKDHKPFYFLFPR
ncbi:hypothetical protein LJY25_13340 [Hymenobacter sp. BT175]|uniref:hypothetical protein n=1 Tax=Hymenobacter translucens TaxID=2886507 RepID=UPI001D0E01B7|nr:hypothetical protein [Hymenobacter translucens]MCC2547433.1 hypothetical protein [Hymenobacter translucens]